MFETGYKRTGDIQSSRIVQQQGQIGQANLAGANAFEVYESAWLRKRKEKMNKELEESIEILAAHPRCLTRSSSWSKVLCQWCSVIGNFFVSLIGKRRLTGFQRLSGNPISGFNRPTLFDAKKPATPPIKLRGA